MDKETQFVNKANVNYSLLSTVGNSMPPVIALTYSNNFILGKVNGKLWGKFGEFMKKFISGAT